MRSRRLSAPAARSALSVAGLLTLIVVALAYLGSVGVSVTENRHVRTATLHVPDANGLVEGSRVLYLGIPIGRIVGVTSSGSGVEIALNYKTRYRIPEDSHYRVDNLSALGESYLGITPQVESGRALPDGVRLTGARTTVPTTFTELSARLTRLLEQVNVTNVRKIITETNTGLVSDPVVIDQLARAGALLESTVLTTRGSLRDLLERFQTWLDHGAAISPYARASGVPIADFGTGFSKFLGIAAGTKEYTPDHRDGFVPATDSPRLLNEVAGPLLQKIERVLDNVSPAAQQWGVASMPSVTSAVERMRSVDVSDLMRTAMATAGDGDGLVVRVGGR